MRKITAVSVRPSLDVDFYENSDEHRAWFRENYVETGLCHVVDNFKTIDLLTSTIVFLWKTAEDYNAFKNEPRVVANYKARRAHNKKFGITREVSRDTVSDAEAARLISARMDHERPGDSK